MAPDCSSIVGVDGTLSKSGKTIYDSLRESPEFFLPAGDLESILRAGLLGFDLNYPLRTRSKVLKSKICDILGYPAPTSFKKSKPRFPGQDFDTYIQKSNNLQIWNEEIVPTRRYAVFYGTVVGAEVRLDHLVLTRGADFFSFFQRFEGKVINAKLQIPLPRGFFG
jgi:hypothetical protein